MPEYVQSCQLYAQVNRKAKILISLIWGNGKFLTRKCGSGKDRSERILVLNFLFLHFPTIVFSPHFDDT